MSYPNEEQIERADHAQLAYWVRFLPSPGSRATGMDPASFQLILLEEKEILDRIIARFNEMGGMTPEISKEIGW